MAQDTNLLIAEVVQTHSAGLSTRFWGALCCLAQTAAPGLEGCQPPHHAVLEQIHLAGEGRHKEASWRAGGTRVPGGVGGGGWLSPGLQVPAGSALMPAAGPGARGLCRGAWPPAGWHSTAAAGASGERSRVSGVPGPLYTLPPRKSSLRTCQVRSVDSMFPAGSWLPLLKPPCLPFVLPGSAPAVYTAPCPAAKGTHICPQCRPLLGNKLSVFCILGSFFLAASQTPQPKTLSPSHPYPYPVLLAYFLSWVRSPTHSSGLSIPMVPS